GQPCDGVQWSGDPWAPVSRDRPLEQGGREVPRAAWKPPLDPEWRLYARSASDDKAPIVGLLAALDALKAGGVAPSVNVKLFFECEVAAGSPPRAPLLKA